MYVCLSSAKGEREERRRRRRGETERGEKKAAATRALHVFALLLLSLSLPSSSRAESLGNCAAAPLLFSSCFYILYSIALLAHFFFLVADARILRAPVIGAAAGAKFVGYGYSPLSCSRSAPRTGIYVYTAYTVTTPGALEWGAWRARPRRPGVSRLAHSLCV